MEKLVSEQDLKSFDVPGALYEGKPISYWADRLGADDPDEQIKNIEAFRALGPQAIPALFHLLLYDRKRYYWAERAISRLGPAVIPQLVDLVRNCDPVSRSKLASTFHYFGDDAIQPMIALLDDPSRETKLAVIKALYSFGPTARAAIPALLKLLDQSDSATQDAALRTLISIDHSLEKIQWRVKEKLRSPDIETRLKTMKELGPLGGTEIDPVIRELVAELDGRRSYGYARPTLQIVSIGGRSVPILIEALYSERPDVRHRAAKCLGGIREEYADECEPDDPQPPWDEPVAPITERNRLAYLAGVRPLLGVIIEALIDLCFDKKRRVPSAVIALGYGDLSRIPNEVLPRYLDAVRIFSPGDFARALADMLIRGDEIHSRSAIDIWPTLGPGFKVSVLGAALFSFYYDDEIVPLSRTSLVSNLRRLGYAPDKVLSALAKARRRGANHAGLAKTLVREREGLSWMIKTVPPRARRIPNIPNRHYPAYHIREERRLPGPFPIGRAAAYSVVAFIVGVGGGSLIFFFSTRHLNEMGDWPDSLLDFAAIFSWFLSWFIVLFGLALPLVLMFDALFNQRSYPGWDAHNDKS